MPHRARRSGSSGDGAPPSSFKPTCPGIYITRLEKADYVERDYDETIYTAAHCVSMKFRVECHLSTAFVTAYSQWVVSPALLQEPGASVAFAVPLDPGATVTSISATTGKKRIESCVVPVAQTKEFKGVRFGRTDPAPLATHPEVFALTIPGVRPNEPVDVTVTYFQPLAFVNGAYVFEAPTTIPPDSLGVGPLRLSSVLSFVATVRSAYPGEVPIECGTHPIALVQKGSGVTQVQLDPAHANNWVNRNVEIRMPVWSDHIVAAAVQQPPPRGPAHDTRSAFAIALAPPRPECCAPFPRSVVFLLDRSGSMFGQPMASANEALLTGLRSLTPHDRFNIVAFDNLQEYLSNEGLVQAVPEAVERAIAWVSTHCTARGTTDIMTPLQGALAMLAKSGAPGSIPFVFLITDGAVENEREICKVTQQAQGCARAGGMAALPRVCTFGIGRYCNHYFLKMLATIGRGLSDAAFTPDRIARQMTALLSAACSPVLTDVQIGISGDAGLEIYPFPVPDLFVGSPVMVSGKIQGGLPPVVEIKGRLANGQEWSNRIQVMEDLGNNALDVPLDKVFIKQRIDLLTGKAWLQREAILEDEVVALSVQYGVPSVHTNMCAFETTKAKQASMEAARKSGKSIRLAKYAVGGAAGVLVLGAMAGADFGNVGASAANMGSSLVGAGESFGASIAGLDLDFPDIGSCSCIEELPCGDMCGDLCGDVEPCMAAAGTCVSNVADALLGCFSGD